MQCNLGWTSVELMLCYFEIPTKIWQTSQILLIRPSYGCMRIPSPFDSFSLFTNFHSHHRCEFSGVIVYGSDQEVAELMKAVGRNNGTGMFTWIGSDGWSARTLVSEGRRTILLSLSCCSCPANFP